MLQAHQQRSNRNVLLAPQAALILLAALLELVADIEGAQHKADLAYGAGLGIDSNNGVSKTHIILKAQPTASRHTHIRYLLGKPAHALALLLSLHG